MLPPPPPFHILHQLSLLHTTFTQAVLLNVVDEMEEMVLMDLAGESNLVSVAWVMW